MTLSNMDTPPPLDPKGAAGKLKPQLQLIPPALNTETAKALQHGADKYGPWNWRTAKVEIMTYIGAMKRHIDAVLNRQDFDPASGAHHLGHVAASCGIVLDAAQNGTLVDNRPPVERMADLVWFGQPLPPQEMMDFRVPHGAVVTVTEGLRRGEVITTPPAFKRPIDGMTLTTLMSRIHEKTVYTTEQYQIIEEALRPLFEPTPVQ